MPGDKIALITGANKGIGFEIARQLGERGAIVLLGARNDVRGKQAADSLTARGLSAVPVQLDVTDSASIADAASEIEQRYGHLDILVNNAGVFGSFGGPPSEATPDHLREVYDTNVFGVVAVTNAMLPLLRRSSAGRIVNMASDLGSLTQCSDPEFEFRAFNAIAYQSSKTALNAITVAYARELRETSIKVNSAIPGYVASDMNNHSGYRTTEQGAVIAVRLATLGPDGPTGTSQNDNGIIPW